MSQIGRMGLCLWAERRLSMYMKNIHNAVKVGLFKNEVTLIILLFSACSSSVLSMQACLTQRVTCNLHQSHRTCGMHNLASHGHVSCQQPKQCKKQKLLAAIWKTHLNPPSPLPPQHHHFEDQAAGRCQGATKSYKGPSVSEGLSPNQPLTGYFIKLSTW